MVWKRAKFFRLLRFSIVSNNSFTADKSNIKLANKKVLRQKYNHFSGFTIHPQAIFCP